MTNFKEEVIDKVFENFQLREFTHQRIVVELIDQTIDLTQQKMIEDFKEELRKLGIKIKTLHDEQRESQGITTNPEVAMERLNKASLVFGNGGILEKLEELKKQVEKT